MATQDAAMTSAVAALQAQLDEARSNVNSGFFFGAASDLRVQFNGQLDQAQRAVNRLDGDLRASVNAGAFSFASWKQIAQAQVELIASTDQNSEGPDLSAFWSQVVSQTAGDVSTLVKTAVPHIETTVTIWLVVAAVALVALAVIRVKG